MKKTEKLIKLTLTSLAVALVLSLTSSKTTNLAGIDPPTPPGNSVITEVATIDPPTPPGSPIHI